MGLSTKGSAVLRNLKTAAKAKANSLPTAPLLHVMADQVNQLEHGIKSRVDGLQDKVKSLQTNLTKIYQANTELEAENNALTRQLVALEKENTAMGVALERSEMERSLLEAKLENIRTLIASLDDPTPARRGRAAGKSAKASKGKRA
ncbi:hypothetical protein [Limnobacter sp.]|uniref:hypothetical protein n=1 Tax=Limnobacter sp. TaxID=2003368 RepID=UPI0035191AF4